MSLVSMRNVLLNAKKSRYAVTAFNIENMEMAQTVIQTAAELRSPVIIQTTPGTIKYAGLSMLHAMVAEEAEKVDIPVVLHLDHGNSFELCCDAIREKYTSVMIDGSKLPFEENVELTSKVVRKAAQYGIDVEGELGLVGGKEDSHQVKSDAKIYTDPQQAYKFWKLTGVHSLAIAIGTSHGFYKGKPKLDFERLKEISKLVDIPIVLHGASGLPDEQIQKAVSLGICKVNFATELRAAFTSGVRKALFNQSVYDPKVFLHKGSESVAEIVRHKIAICGCERKV